jgi:hypothetical protein
MTLGHSSISVNRNALASMPRMPAAWIGPTQLGEGTGSGDARSLPSVPPGSAVHLAESPTSSRLNLRNRPAARRYSRPHAGRVERAFARLFADGMSAATARRVFSTLRTALNAAVREGLIPGSPARYVAPLPRARRPFAVVWTKRRVEEWQRTGERPAVAVWAPEQLSAFLSSVAASPTYLGNCRRMPGAVSSARMAARCHRRS